MTDTTIDRRHIPVLCAEVITALQPVDGAHYVDATFGAGGYAAAILNSANCTLTGLDRDPSAIAEGAALIARFQGRLSLVLSRFSQLAGQFAAPVDGIVFDLGVSSMQLDRAERGFSFRFDGPLDMRMGESGQTAAELVNTASEEDLADIIFLYGEERHARRVAKEIVSARSSSEIITTAALAALVRRVVPMKKFDIDPATRTFQALRMAVNQELQELAQGLSAAEKVLKPGGRLIIVTFHSLEDRLVKTFLKQRCGLDGAPSRHLPGAAPGRAPSFTLLHRKPVAPGEAEIARNPRARSAKLRAAIRTEAPAWEQAA
jgi:16S rRNA (cytosine1402-N4)-methyltransferase